MKESDSQKLSRIHGKLNVIERELAGYSTLMGSLYGEVTISGEDLIGPSQALARNSRKIQKILHQLDTIIVKEQNS